MLYSSQPRNLATGLIIVCSYLKNVCVCILTQPSIVDEMLQSNTSCSICTYMLHHHSSLMWQQKPFICSETSKGTLLFKRATAWRPWAIGRWKKKKKAQWPSSSGLEKQHLLLPSIFTRHHRDKTLERHLTESPRASGGITEHRHTQSREDRDAF